MKPRGYPVDPLINPLHLGLRIKAARRKAGLGIEECVKALVAEGLFTRTSVYYNYEDGKHVPTHGRLQVLARLFGVKVDDLTQGAVPGLEEYVRNIKGHVKEWRLENPDKNSLAEELEKETAAKKGDE